MLKRSVFIFAFAIVSLIFGVSAFAQTPATAAAQGDAGITPNGVIGEVKVIDTANKQMIVKTDAGSLVTVVLSDASTYMRTAPGEKTLDKAAKITLADVKEGDRIFARGKVADDRKSLPARVLVVMSKEDIAAKQEQERAEWRRRGILGVISALNPTTKEITISTRTMQGPQPVIIPVSDKVEMRRYAPDSIKFSDAKPSEFTELKVGDQLRALGDRSADGARFVPEKVVTGAFRMAGGAVTAVDAATGEVKITDLQTKQPLTIVVKKDSLVRRFPAEMGMMMMGGGQRPAGGAAPGAGGPPAGGGQAGGPNGGPGGGGGGGRMGGNIQEMIERLPTITVADLKPGETIIVSSTQGADPTRLTAITVVAGADAILNMMQARQQARPGGQAGGGGGGVGGGGGGFGIGIGLP